MKNAGLGPEERLIDWLRRRTGDAPDAPGDDAAFLASGRELAVSVDQQVQGVHFVDDLDPRLVGRRLTRVCLSDLAAVGAEPRYAFLTLAAPAHFPARRLMAAVLEECRSFGLSLAGGDLSSAERVHTALTVLGSRPARGRWVRRGGARAGDRLWVGGLLGDSSVGRELIRRGARPRGRSVDLPRSLPLPPGGAVEARKMVRRHLLPEPQLELGLWLSRRRRAAALDISDGLALDLHRLCRASGLGAVIEEQRLPTSRRFNGVCSALGLEAPRQALGGGEDYVLLFALPESLRPPSSLGCTPVGRLTAEGGVRIRRGGRLCRLPPAGWDHLEVGR